MWHSPLPSRLRCSNCRNSDQQLFVFDNTEGSCICTRCGGVVSGYIMQQMSYSDRQLHNVRLNERCQLGFSSKRKKTTVFTKNVRQKHEATENILQFAGSSRPAASHNALKVRENVERFAQHFRAIDRVTDVACAFYLRNQDYFEKNFVMSKETWAAAVFFLAREDTGASLTLAQLVGAMPEAKLEAKKIHKSIQIIRSVDDTLKKRHDTKDQTQYKEVSSVPHYADSLQMPFKAQRLTQNIVQYICKNEVIEGLNPKSILAVSFFLALTLTQQNSDENTKNNLNRVSKLINIASNTIKKGIKNSREEILDYLQTNAIFTDIGKIGYLKNLHI